MKTTKLLSLIVFCNLSISLYAVHSPTAPKHNTAEIHQEVTRTSPNLKQKFQSYLVKKITKVKQKKNNRKKNNNELGILSLFAGIAMNLFLALAILLNTPILLIFALALGVAGFILGLKGIKKSKSITEGKNGRRASVAGLILSCSIVLLSALANVISLVALVFVFLL